MTSALGLKARVDFSLARFLACILFLRITYGVTPANLLTASMAADPIPAFLSQSVRFLFQISYLFPAGACMLVVYVFGMDGFTAGDNFYAVIGLLLLFG